jgi:hypothetical protein
MKQLLVVVVFILTLSACGRRDVEAKDRKSVISPDGKLVARIAVTQLTGHIRLQQVFVMSRDVSVRLKGGETAGMIAAIVEACRDENFDVSWRSNGHLIIEYRQDRPSWVNFIPVVNGVEIELIDRSKRPNQSPEPTVMLVTPRAGARVAPSTTVAHL